MASARLSVLTALLFAVLLPVPLALGQQPQPSMTVEGKGSADRRGSGIFEVTLPDGTTCVAYFSGGKISLTGPSAARAKAKCKSPGGIQTVRATVSRRWNGSPKEATLVLKDGTRVLVTFPDRKD